MNDNFEYKCRRRSGGRRKSPANEESVLASEENFGAGSGGEWYNGSHDHHYDGWYSLSSPGMDLWAQGKAYDNSYNSINLRTIPNDTFSNDGDIVLAAVANVEITTGGPDISKELFEDDHSGFRVEVPSQHLIGLYHGPSASRGSSLEFTHLGVALNVEEDKNFTVVAAGEIYLAAAGGHSYIMLSSDGIILKGPVIQIN